MIEKWKKSIDQRKNAGALLTDLSEAFDCISHNLRIAKLEAYGVDTNSLYIIHSYLTNRYQRVRVNGEYSSWFEIIFGVPQFLMREVFVLKQSQKYCSRQIFDTRNVRTVHNGIETLTYLGIKIWAIIPPDIKSISDILIFKRKIRLRKPDKCPCRLCKNVCCGCRLC